MPIAFPQTTRALKADKDQTIIIWLSFAILLFFGWFIWFFNASVEHYIGSEKIDIYLESQPSWKIPDGERRPLAYRRYRLTGYFSAKNLVQISIEQKVKIYLHSTDTLPPQALLSTVSEVHPKTGAIVVFLEIPANNLDPLLSAKPRRLDIAIYQQSPAEFLFHIVDSNIPSVAE